MTVKHGAYHYTPTINKKKRWFRLSDDYSEALRRYADQVDNGIRPANVADGLAIFWAAAEPGYADSTKPSYQKAIKTLTEVFGELQPEHISEKDINYFLRHHKSATEANRQVSVLSEYYKWMVRQGYIEKYNPCQGAELNVIEARERYVEDWELEALCNAATEQMRLMLGVAYLTGARLSAILRIRLQDIHEDYLLIRETKQIRKQKQARKKKVKKYVDRRFYLYNEDGQKTELWHVLDKCKRLRRRVSSFHLFCNRWGQQYTVSGFESNWARLRTKAGVDNIRFSDIRKKTGTDAGLKRARYILGHTTDQTTRKHYVQFEKTEPLK